MPYRTISKECARPDGQLPIGITAFQWGEGRFDDGRGQIEEPVVYLGELTLPLSEVMAAMPKAKDELGRWIADFGVIEARSRSTAAFPRCAVRWLRTEVRS